MTDRLAVVVGAGGDIGGACARALARTGDPVLCADLDLGRAERTAAAIRAAGGEASALRVDATDPGFSAEVVAAVPVGARVTAAVHAVAHEEHVPAERVARAGLERAFAAGPIAAFALFRDLVAGGHAGRGSALTAIGSLHADHAFAGYLAYNAAQGALAQVVRTLAHEWAGRGIRVNAVVPGWIRTTAEERFYGGERLDRAAVRLPMGRMGTPEDVAEAVAYLSSARAGYVCGTFLTVDGALSAAFATLGEEGSEA